MATTQTPTRRGVRWAFDVANSPFGGAAEPSTPETSTSSLAYVNSQIIAHGFARVALDLSELGREEQNKVVKCMLGMLSQRVNDMTRAEDLSTRLRNVSYEHERLSNMLRAAKNEVLQAEREAEAAKTKANSIVKDLSSANTSHNRTTAQLAQTTSAIAALRAASIADMRKREQEIGKLRERWQRLSAEQAKLGTVGSGMVCSNWAVAVNEQYVGMRGEGEEAAEGAMRDAIEARERLAEANDEFREVMVKLVNIVGEGLREKEVPDVKIPTPATLFNPSAIEDDAGPALNAYRTLRDLIQQLAAAGSTHSLDKEIAARETERAKQEQHRQEIRGWEEKVEKVEREMAKLKGELAASNDFCEKSRLLIEQMVNDKKTLEKTVEERDTGEAASIVEQRQQLEEERAKFTDAAIRLARERSDFEAERLALAEEKRQWATRQLEEPAQPVPEPLITITAPESDAAVPPSPLIPTHNPNRQPPTDEEEEESAPAPVQTGLAGQLRSALKAAKAAESGERTRKKGKTVKDKSKSKPKEKEKPRPKVKSPAKDKPKDEEKENIASGSTVPAAFAPAPKIPTTPRSLHPAAQRARARNYAPAVPSPLSRIISLAESPERGRAEVEEVVQLPSKMTMTLRSSTNGKGRSGSQSPKGSASRSPKAGAGGSPLRTVAKSPPRVTGGVGGGNLADKFAAAAAKDKSKKGKGKEKEQPEAETEADDPDKTVTEVKVQAEKEKEDGRDLDVIFAAPKEKAKAKPAGPSRGGGSKVPVATGKPLRVPVVAKRALTPRKATLGAVVAHALDAIDWWIVERISIAVDTATIMAPSQPPSTSSPHPAHTAGPSTISSSSTSPTGTHSTVATTVGNLGNSGNAGNRQRSWDEDKHLNLYILDYCRRRKFDDAASAFAREANLSLDSKASFDAPQGLLFEWWIVFWETFNSQRSSISGPPGQRESGQVYVNTMARLRKLAVHEKDEQNRARSMSMSISTPGMPPMMSGIPPAMNGSGSASAMSTPAMTHMPNPMGPRPQSQASGRTGPQQPGMGQQPMAPGAPGQPGMAPQQQGPGMAPNGPGPQQPGMSGHPQPGIGQPQRPQQPGMGMPPTGMTPSALRLLGLKVTYPDCSADMTHASTPHASTPSAPHVSSSPSPVPTPPQSFAPGGPGGPGPQQSQFNPQFNPQQQFSGPGGPGQPQFPGQPGQFQGALGNQPFRPGQGQNGPPVQNAHFPPNAGPGFQPGGPGNQNFGQQGFQPGGPGSGQGPQQQFQPGNAQFPGGPGIGGPGPGGPGGPFPPGARQGGPGLQFPNNNQPPEWGQRPPPMGQGGPEPGRRPDGSWEDARRAGMIGGQPNKMGPGQMRYVGQPGPGGHPPNMMGQPGMSGGPQMGGPMQSPKEDARSITPQQTQANWEGGVTMQRRPGMALQGGQMGPRPGFNPQGPQGQGAQKRAGSPAPPATMNNVGGSPPEKRARPNDPGPGVLVDSRMGQDGRPTSSKGGASFPGGPGMNGQPPNPQQQRLNGEQQYRQEVGGATREMRVQVLGQGGPQPPPFGKGQQANGRGSRPTDAPSPASGGEGAGQPRQVMNVKGQGGSMGPPVSPSLAHRNVGGMKKSDSAGNSPALPPSTVPNGMNPADRSHTPQQMKPGGSHSPMTMPMSRPQSAQPTIGQGPSIGVPAPPPSAPPMFPPTQSPSNGLLPFSAAKLEPQFDFPEDVDLTNFDEFFPGMDPILGLESWAHGGE
ncbi:unnamed protein product [Rhizoctonia solani]|uniref:LisH domain-containing protein n=1 Tax=Rhizoctonia solani TaxID=456999 RepID=A0A8H3DYD1_9AGAM|nr:unnamed protein product [Rhizoctonia solani]